MKSCILALILSIISMLTLAAEAPAGVEFDSVEIDLDDKVSLQRGARIFVNYCLSCHSAAYMRYNRMGKDLGITEDQLKENLMFAAEKPGELMKVTIPKEEAKDWFGGVAPPDLTLIARYRGPKWIYNYLRGFYREDKSSSGWGNIAFPGFILAMPHVFYEWQGIRRAIFETDKDGIRWFRKFEVEKPGTMDEVEYDRAMRDLTNFLVYLGEPAQLVRYRIGKYVLIFLAVFFVFVYFLKREYWKDVH